MILDADGKPVEVQPVPDRPAAAEQHQQAAELARRWDDIDDEYRALTLGISLEEYRSQPDIEWGRSQ